MRLIVLPGVFRPISDSRLLAAAVRDDIRPGARVLDVCTGSGLVAVSAALGGAQASATDVSRRAVVCARLNARLNGVRVRALRGSLLDPVAGERFDVIASNPPYVPGEDDTLPNRGLERAWEGGLGGRVLLDRLIALAPHHLHPGGALLLTHSTIIGEDETLQRLDAAGLEPEVLVRRPGPLGPLMAGRRQHLERQGLLAPGQDTEEVLIIRGRLTRVRRRPASEREGAAMSSGRP